MVSTSNDRLFKAALGILIGVWAIAIVPMAEAQEVDSRWAPWLGCWQAVDEAQAAPLLCVVPFSVGPGIEMLTVVDGRVVTRESIFADGQEHATSREECEGWAQAEFSSDSHRIYIRSELTCDESELGKSTGVLSMVSPFEWLDVRTMNVDGQSLPWVVRYRLASRSDFRAAGQTDLIETQNSDTQTARVVASRPINLDDVMEAAEILSDETMQVWLVERGDPFALDATRLIEMADAGVAPRVIDVVVAVSYPEKFVVNDRTQPGVREEDGSPARQSSGYAQGANPFIDPFYDPYARSASSSLYGPGRMYGSGFYGAGSYGGFGYGRGLYGVSPMGSGYGGWGYNNPGYGGYNPGYGGYNAGYGGYDTPIVVVGLRQPPQEGRVVPGGGYTSAGSSSQNSGRSAQPRSSGGRTQSAGSSSGSARSAPARSSSGSSGRSTGRTAQPRSGGRN